MIPFPRDLLCDPEIGSAVDLALSTISDEEHKSALSGVVRALQLRDTTKTERSRVWRRLISGDE